MEKVLSIVIPTYNMEKYLGKCLDSLIIDENMESLEILVINDGSKDGSLSIAQSYYKKYPNTFKVIDKKNGNYGSCINRRLKEATGKYIKILDADDYFNKAELIQLIDKMKSIDTDVVITDYQLVSESNAILADVSFKWLLNTDCEYNIGNILSQELTDKIQMHAISYRLDFLKNINYIQTEGISYTDQEWVFTPIALATSLYYIHLHVYNYLIGREGQTMNTEIYDRNSNQLVTLLKSLVYRINEIEIDAQRRKYLERRISQLLCKLYQIYIYRKYRNIKELIDFDTWLKEKDESIYKLANQFTLNKYLHFVSYWRKHQNIHCPLLIKVNYKLKQILLSIK